MAHGRLLYTLKHVWDNLTVRDVRNKLVARLRAYVTDDGIICPCCGQHVELQRRSLYAGMARVLEHMLAHGATYPYDTWCYAEAIRASVGMPGGDWCKARHCGLIEESPANKHNWRLTALGEQFVTTRVSVPRYALTYNDTCYKLDGPAIYITELGADANDDYTLDL